MEMVQLPLTIYVLPTPVLFPEEAISHSGVDARAENSLLLW